MGEPRPSRAARTPTGDSLGKRLFLMVFIAAPFLVVAMLFYPITLAVEEDIAEFGERDSMSREQQRESGRERSEPATGRSGSTP